MLVFCVPGTLLNQFDERDIEKINNDDLYVWLFVKHKQKDVDKAIDMIVSIEHVVRIYVNAVLEQVLSIAEKHQIYRQCDFFLTYVG